jgi:hypothetical protein
VKNKFPFEKHTIRSAEKLGILSGLEKKRLPQNQEVFQQCNMVMHSHLEYGVTSTKM